MDYDNLKICVDAEGNYLGAHIGAVPAETSEFVPTRPNDDRDIWDFLTESWIPHVETPVYPTEVILQSPSGTLVKVWAEDDGKITSEPI